MGKSGGWLQGIQYFRAIAAIEVIVIHATSYGYSLPPFQKDLIIACVALTSFAVPHFIFISGVVLYNKYSEGFSLSTLSTFYKKRFSSVLPPYLVWSTFYYSYPFVIVTLFSALFRRPSLLFGSNVGFNLGGFVTALASGIGQLWFLLLLMQLYLLYPFLVKLYNRFSRQKHTIYVLLLVFLAQLVFNLLFVPLDSHNIFFLSCFFYFVLGFFVAEQYGTIIQRLTSVRLSSMSIVVVLSTICYASIFIYNSSYWVSADSRFLVPLQYVWFYQVTGPLYCALLIAFYLRLGTDWGEPHGFFTRSLDKIGEESFGIYLTHLFFIVLFTASLTTAGLGYNNLLFYPTLVLLTLISSYWSVRGLYRLPFSTIVLGKPRKKESELPQTERIPSAQ